MFTCFQRSIRHNCTAPITARSSSVKMEHRNPKLAGKVGRNTLLVFALFTLSTGQWVVYRQGQMLNAIPTDINMNVTRLYLTDNSIAIVDDDDLASLMWLEILDMNSNPISFINTNAFINNKRLIKIFVSQYMLAVFPAGFGGSWPYLVHLGCKKGLIPMQSFSLTRFPVLEYLSVSDNQIQSLQIGDLPSLKSFYAMRCGLNTFPDLSSAPNLEIVQLHRNNFSHITQSAIMGLTRLRRLSIPTCHVRYLPDFSHLVSLEVLNINKNYIISSLPDLYHLPLTTLLMVSNPMLCDKRLCWIRMWNNVKPILTTSEITCAYPSNHMGSELMSINPTDMNCYEGILCPRCLCSDILKL